MGSPSDPGCPHLQVRGHRQHRVKVCILVWRQPHRCSSETLPSYLEDTQILPFCLSRLKIFEKKGSRAAIVSNVVARVASLRDLAKVNYVLDWHQDSTTQST